MDAALKDKLLKDLQKAGFESEMRAIQAIKSADWDCEGSSAYFDKDESITRNVDAHASLTRGLYAFDDESAVSNFEYNLFIEVKKSERPWVVFKRDAGTYMDRQGFYPKVMHGMTSADFNGPIGTTFRNSSLTKQLGWQGYGVHEAFKEPQDAGRWYAAAVTACKACCNFFGDDEGKTIPTQDHWGLAVAQPVVILDGPLIAAKINKSGDVELEEVSYAPFLFEFGTASYKRSQYRVDLVSLPAVAAYLKFCSLRVDTIFEALDSAAKSKNLKGPL